MTITKLNNKIIKEAEKFHTSLLLIRLTLCEVTKGTQTPQTPKAVLLFYPFSERHLQRAQQSTPKVSQTAKQRQEHLTVGFIS